MAASPGKGLPQFSHLRFAEPLQDAKRNSLTHLWLEIPLLNDEILTLAGFDSPGPSWEQIGSQGDPGREISAHTRLTHLLFHFLMIAATDSG
jgi:hypothetical protein